MKRTPMTKREFRGERGLHTFDETKNSPLQTRIARAFGLSMEHTQLPSESRAEFRPI